MKIEEFEKICYDEARILNGSFPFHLAGCDFRYEDLGEVETGKKLFQYKIVFTKGMHSSDDLSYVYFIVFSVDYDKNVLTMQIFNKTNIKRYLTSYINKALTELIEVTKTIKNNEKIIIDSSLTKEQVAHVINDAISKNLEIRYGF